jgi:hypothetical protein
MSLYIRTGATVKTGKQLKNGLSISAKQTSTPIQHMMNALAGGLCPREICGIIYRENKLPLLKVPNNLRTKIYSDVQTFIPIVLLAHIH